MYEQDRCSKTKGKWTGSKDDLDEQDFQRRLGRNFGLFEAYQDEMTHENGMALSRLDRIYLNDHQLEQFDREYRTVALDANSLSDQRAVGLRKQIPARKQSTCEGFPILPQGTRTSLDGYTWNSTACCARSLPPPPWSA